MTISAIIKEPIDPRLECELIAFNGTILELAFIRPWTANSPTRLRVSDYFTGAILSDTAWPALMGCAIVSNGVIHVFGSTDWSAGNNKVVRSTLDANFVPSTPVDALLPNSNFKIYNTSVTLGPNGFRMAVETNLATWFARASDLSNPFVWSGGQWPPSPQYSGCPTLDYVGDGKFFMTVLKNVGEKFVTQAVKSTDDCFTFTEFAGKSGNPAGAYMLSPSVREGINNSDVSFAELNGKVYGCYLDGDQSTMANARRFTYNGTLAQLYAEFF